jgi:hypothetical protein
MAEITSGDVLNIFDNDEPIWNDRWHLYTRKKIEEFIQTNQNIINESKHIINAGSSGETYNIDDKKTLHIDLVEKRIEDKPHHLVANLEDIPINSQEADLIVCVGSVINFSDAMLVIKELTKLLKPNGNLILEFECSNTPELFWSNKFNATAVIHDTFYRHKLLKIWYYSEEWIESILKEYGYTIVNKSKWHFLSAFMLKFIPWLDFCSLFSTFDALARKIPIVKNYSSNIILLAKKVNA